MRQLMFTGPGRVGWAEVPAPRLRDQKSALVRPLAVARCDLDLPMVTRALFPGPYPVGHEVVADLAASGRLHAHVVTTKVAEWDDAPDAWLALATKLVLVRN